MSSKLTKISIALLLSAVVAPSVFASEIVILSPEEEQAVRTAKPATVKKIAQDAVSTATASGVQSNLDAYEERLGGDEETIKAELGIGGYTSILEDIRAAKTKIGVGTTISGGLTQLITQTGVAATTVTAAIAGMGGGGSADITGRIGHVPSGGNLPDINAEIARLDPDPVINMAQATTGIMTAVDGNPTGPTSDDLLKRVTDTKARLTTVAPANARVGINTVVEKIQTAAAVGTENIETLLDAQVDRIDTTTPKLEVALDTTIQLFGATAPVALASHNAELNAERTAILDWINNSPANLAAVQAYVPAEASDKLTFMGAGIQPGELILVADPLNTIHKLLLAAKAVITL